MKLNNHRIRRHGVNIWAIGLLLTLFAGRALACDLTYMNLVSVTGSGPYVITVNLCIGMGISGATKGAGASTGSISFGFFSSSPTFAVTAFTPAQMVSPAPAQTTTPPRCTMPGIIGGPNTTLQTAANVYYTMPNSPPCAGSAFATSYGCVSSTILCGLAQSSCSTYTFTVNQMPDSMRAFGPEGAGNPFGYCYTDANTVIYFFPPFALEWGAVGTTVESAGVHVTWETLKVEGGEEFQVERSLDGVEFSVIGELPANGTTDQSMTYTYLDRTPLDGHSYYRVVLRSRDGGHSHSTVVEADYFRPEGLSWGAVGPDPCADHLDAAFHTREGSDVQVQVLDLCGRMVHATTIAAVPGGNRLRLPTESIAAGHYYLRLSRGDSRIVRSFRKG